MEILFDADQLAVKKTGFPCDWYKYTPKYFVKFDVGTEILFTFKEFMIDF